MLPTIYGRPVSRSPTLFVGVVNATRQWRNESMEFSYTPREQLCKSTDRYLFLSITLFADNVKRIVRNLCTDARGDRIHPSDFHTRSVFIISHPIYARVEVLQRLVSHKVCNYTAASNVETIQQKAINHLSPRRTYTSVTRNVRDAEKSEWLHLYRTFFYVLPADST